MGGRMLSDLNNFYRIRQGFCRIPIGWNLTEYDEIRVGLDLLGSQQDSASNNNVYELSTTNTHVTLNRAHTISRCVALLDSIPSSSSNSDQLYMTTVNLD
jgi:hypothetical protein